MIKPKGCLHRWLHVSLGSVSVRQSNVLARFDKEAVLETQRPSGRDAPRGAAPERQGHAPGRGARAAGTRPEARRPSGRDTPRGAAPERQGHAPGRGARAAGTRPGARRPRDRDTPRGAGLNGWKAASQKISANRAKPACLPPFYRQNRYIYGPSDPNGQKAEPNGQKNDNLACS